MEWTPETIGLLFVGLAALIGALTTAVVQLVTLVREVRVVHELVNSRMTAVLDRVTQLTEALIDADVELPADPADPLRTP